MSEERQEINPYLRKKKGDKRKCVQVTGYKRKVHLKGDTEDHKTEDKEE